MVYAFARDNGMPFSSYAKLVHRRTQAPVYGVLYMLLLAGLLCTPMCFNAFVFPVGAGTVLCARQPLFWYWYRP